MTQPECNAAGKECPIAHMTCPGPCVFADVMQSASLAIALANIEESRLIFQNGESRTLLPNADFETLNRLFRMDHPLPVSDEPHEVRAGSRLIGYTLYGSGPFRWVFYRDITDKHRLEALAAAMEQTNSLGFVFSTVRHELGNPVNSIKTALTVLKMNLERGQEQKTQDYVDRCLAELGRIEALLKALKNFSLFEDLEPRPLSLRQVLDDFVLLAGPQAAARGVHLDYSPPVPSLGVLADPRGMQQVLTNLLTNAFDAVSGKPNPVVRISSHSLEPGVVQLVFEDNGGGLDAAAREHLFKPFFTTKPKGTGLGLVISRKALARMRATISAESAPGGGTAFLITLRSVSGGSP